MVKKIFSTFASNIFIGGLNLLIAILVSQILGADGKGEQSIIITTIAMILLACNIVGGTSLVYLVPRYDNKKIIILSYLWSFLVCALVYLIMLLIPYFNNEFILHISILTFFNSLISVNSMIVLGKEKIDAKNIISIVQTFSILFSLFFLFFIIKKSDIYTYIFSLYFSYIVTFLVSSYYLIKYIKINKVIEDIKESFFRCVFRLGFYNQLSHITQMVSLRLSYYLLLLYWIKDSVGIYSGAVALVESVWLISKSIATVQYARIANSDNTRYKQQITIKLLRSTLFFSVILLLIMSLLPSAFYQFLFGKEFSDVNKLIILLSPGVFMYNIFLILGHYFSGNGKYNINTIASFLGFIVTIIFCLILIPTQDYYGAAIAAVMSYLITSLYVIIVFLKETKYRFVDLFPNKEDVKEYFNFIKNIRQLK